MITLVVDEVLNNNAELVDLTAEISPVLAISETKDPVITYFTKKIDPQYSPKGVIRSMSDTYTVVVEAWSDSFSDSLKVMLLARESLEDMRGVIKGMNVSYCRVVDGGSGVDENRMFVYSYTFEIKIKNI